MSQPLGEYVSFLRKKRGLTQKDLADKLGYTIQSISRFEQGEMQLALIVMPDLATLLGISLDDLFARRAITAPLAVPNPRIDRAILCANLISLRQQHRYSQDKEAELLGISSRSVANYEQGETIPPFDIAEKILALYKIAPSTLFYGQIEAADFRTIQYADPRQAKRKRGFLIAGAAFCAAVIAIGGTEPLWIPLFQNLDTSLTSALEATLGLSSGESSASSAPSMEKGTSSASSSTASSEPPSSSSNPPSSSTASSSDSASSTGSSSERPDMNPFIPGLKNFYFEPDNTTGWPKAVKPGTYVFHFVFDPTSFTIDSFPDSKYTHYLRFNLPIGTSLIDSQTTEQIPLWEWTLTIPDTVLDGYTVEADAGIKRIGASSTATCMIDFAISNPSNSV